MTEGGVDHLMVSGINQSCAVLLPSRRGWQQSHVGMLVPSWQQNGIGFRICLVEFNRSLGVWEADGIGR